jgi:hypothetical protein
MRTKPCAARVQIEGRHALSSILCHIILLVCMDVLSQPSDMGPDDVGGIAWMEYLLDICMLSQFASWPLAHDGFEARLV